MPFRELAKIFADAIGVGAKIVWSVGVKEHPGSVVMIVGIAADVLPPIDDEAARSALAGEALGENGSRKARADDQIIPSHAGVWR
jgi:hypothetical protein